MPAAANGIRILGNLLAPSRLGKNSIGPQVGRNLFAISTSSDISLSRKLSASLERSKLFYRSVAAPNTCSASSGKTVVHKLLVKRGSQPMSNEVDTSELSKIARLNGDFRRNYGKLLGAYLYSRSISAARGRSWLWGGLFSLACSEGLTWLTRHGWMLPIWP